MCILERETVVRLRRPFAAGVRRRDAARPAPLDHLLVTQTGNVVTITDPIKGTISTYAPQQEDVRVAEAEAIDRDGRAFEKNGRRAAYPNGRDLSEVPSDRRADQPPVDFVFELLDGRG